VGRKGMENEVQKRAEKGKKSGALKGGGGGER
jgi:hypothetical protein